MIYLYLDVYYSMTLITFWKRLFLFNDYRERAQGDSDVELQTIKILGSVNLRSEWQSAACVQLQLT